MAEPRFLLDSNICIYLIQGRSGELRRRMEACETGSVVTSSIVLAEVLRGLDRRDAQLLSGKQAFFDLVQPLPFDVAAADAFARIPFRRGRFDRLIGAHAVSKGLIIVTNNEADFADIPGLRIENWTLPS